MVAQKHRLFFSGTWLIVGLCVYVSSLHNYLLFHSLAEFFSIIVACGIFMFAWNTRKFSGNDYLLFLGTAYLFVAILDLLHTLSYKGMGVFPGYGANPPTQLWVVARYVESLSLLIAPVYLQRRLKPYYMAVAYFLVIAALLSLIFYWRIFPDCFVEGVGLTPFKKISEYIISGLLVGAMLLIFFNQSRLDAEIFRFMIAAVFFSIVAELAFTFYVSVYGLSNLIGHFFKILSFYLIYRAVIQTSLEKPHEVLFKNLKESQEMLALEKDHLQQALSEVKTLSGLLPICAGCKKIRDDEGYWNQIESYIRKHSEAEFSHSLCPDCVRLYYPDLFGDED